jgi:hypothetical protein
MNFLSNLFLSPIVIPVSMIVDIVSLGEFLMRDERTFQFKYRQSEDNFDAIDPQIAMMNFGRIFYDMFETRFKGKRMMLIELMQRHTQAYDLVENLHDLFCRGTKDYRESLSNVQIYNMTKVLTRKTSIPNETGDVKQSICDFDVIHAIQMDIEMYNYVHNVFYDYRKGKFKYERQQSRILKTNEQMFSKVLKESIQYTHMPLPSQNDMTLTRRSNSDLMNNYFIEITARSFTNIEDLLFSKFEDTEALKT